MPRNVYSEINLHLTWHTKNDAPVISDRIEPALHKYLIHRALESEGVIVHAVNGTPDHVHMAVSIPPTLLIADWVGEIKGASSHHINHSVAKPGALAWQIGYGVVSFGTRDLPWVIGYIRNQKEHHARGTVFDRLERIDRIESAPEGGNGAPEGGKPAEAGSGGKHKTGEGDGPPDQP